MKNLQLKLRKPPVCEPTIVTNPVHTRPPRSPRRSKQPSLDASPFMAPARLTDPDLDKRSPQFRIAHVQHFKALKSKFVWYIWHKKVLPFGRWKKEKLFECETFSDEDSGEEDSDYEEFVVPKKKQAKRKREANEAAKPKSYRQPPKPHIRIPKKVVPPAMSNKRLPKPLASMDPPVPPLGPPPKRFN